MSIVEDCRLLLRHAKGANDNRGELRLAPQQRVDDLLAELARIRPPEPPKQFPPACGAQKPRKAKKAKRRKHNSAVPTSRRSGNQISHFPAPNQASGSSKNRLRRPGNALLKGLRAIWAWLAPVPAHVSAAAIRVSDNGLSGVTYVVASFGPQPLELPGKSRLFPFNPAQTPGATITVSV